MIYNQIVSLPVLIENIDLTQVDLVELFATANLQFRSALVLTGAKKSAQLSKRLTDQNSGHMAFRVVDGVNAEKSQANDLRQLVEKNDYDLILGVGGGRVLDTAKYVASRTSLNYLALPTVVSNDGLASPISILYTEGRSRSYSASTPTGILLDRTVIRQADPKFVLSGVGDIISNFSALLDWKLAIKHGKERPSSFAKLLAETAVSNLIELAIEPSSDRYIETYVNSIILCGLSMAISGNSRPCSGAEHLLSHAIVQHGLSRQSHGFLVGSLTGYVAWLHGVREEKPYRFLKQHGYFHRFEDLLDKNFQLSSLFDAARIVRGDRFTILETFSNEQLLKHYSEFVDFMDELST